MDALADCSDRRVCACLDSGACLDSWLKLFKDRGVVVIGVHTNMNPPASVRAHVAEIGLPFPVMVDHPDGRTVSRYQSHGIATSFPSYVLIGPAGKVLLDDRTIAHLSLRSYKLEIIRGYLLAGASMENKR